MGNVHRGRTNGGAWITGLIIPRFARNLWRTTLYSIKGLEEWLRLQFWPTSRFGAFFVNTVNTCSHRQLECCQVFFAFPKLIEATFKQSAEENNNNLSFLMTEISYQVFSV